MTVDLTEYKQKLANINVLLVEDDEINQEVAMDILDDIDLKPVLVENGQLAVDVLNQNHGTDDAFDIILMDLQMPVMDGITATKLIRDEARHQDLPIIALTAHAQNQHEEECLSAGMNGFVSKPFDSQNLFQTLITHCVS